MTKPSKNKELAIKQIATQELQAEKKKMQEYKQMIMQKIMRELQAITQAKKKAIKA